MAMKKTPLYNDVVKHLQKIGFKIVLDTDKEDGVVIFTRGKDIAYAAHVYRFHTCVSTTIVGDREYLGEQYKEIV
jgi:hypothetical protein